MTRKPVVFIPGFPATKLKYRPKNWTIFPPHPLDLLDAEKKKEIVRLLSSPKFNEPADEVFPAEPIRNVLGIAKKADSLYGVLQRQFGYDTSLESTEFHAFGWDWRKGIDDTETQKGLAAVIDQLAGANQKIVVMVHSTGGLVLRKLLEDQPALTQKIEQVVAFGVPWCGTLASIRAMTDPDRIGFGPFALDAQDVIEVMTRSQAAFDICPPDPAKTDMTLADGSPLNLFVENNRQAGALVRDSWIKGEHSAPLAKQARERFGVRTREIRLKDGFTMPPVTNVVAWGAPTLTRYDLGSGGALTPTEAPEGLGDVTVPLVSAAWLRGSGVRTMFLPIGAYPVNHIPRNHPQIFDAPPVVQLLTEVLENAARRPFVAIAVDGDDFQDRAKPTVRILISASDPKGNPLPDAAASFRFGVFSSKKVPLANRMTIVDLDRSSLSPNVNGTDLYRLPVQVRWNGGKADPDPVILFHVT